MSSTIIYKSRQEKILMDELASSSLINLEQLSDIKKHYDESVPYHNFLHALTVAGKVLELDSKEYNLIEIRSLFLAALFHDAGHNGTAKDLDEFRSLDIAFENIEKFEKKYNYEGIDYPIVRKAIIGTVFKNRATNKDKYAKIMADIDIHPLGLEFYEFLFYSDFGMAMEIGETVNGKIDIEKWFKNISYFKFLMGVNKNIFLNIGIRNDLLKNALDNINDYIIIINNNFTTNRGVHLTDIFEYWKGHDCTLDEFRQNFF